MATRQRGLLDWYVADRQAAHGHRLIDGESAAENESGYTPQHIDRRWTLHARLGEAWRPLFFDDGSPHDAAPVGLSGLRADATAFAANEM
jgi:hypothetical protein